MYTRTDVSHKIRKAIVLWIVFASSKGRLFCLSHAIYEMYVKILKDMGDLVLCDEFQIRQHWKLPQLAFQKLCMRQ